MKLSPSGDTLVYSTYLGGSTTPEAGGTEEGASGIAVDRSGHIYVVGDTEASDFPTKNALQASCARSQTGRCLDVFVAKIDPALEGASSLVYSTFLGGNGGDEASAMALDAEGIYVVGESGSTDFPGAPGPACEFVSFVTRLTRTGDALDYTICVKDAGQGRLAGIAVDGSGFAYVTGTSHSGKAYVAKIGEAITVNSNNDTDDSVCDKAHCSLREAIGAANAKSGPDVIFFDIPGGGSPTIQPLTALPAITDPVTIDGTTQSGDGSVKLDGTSAAAGVNGLVIAAGDSTVRGLVVKNFPKDGIVLSGEGGNKVESNIITSNGGNGITVLSGTRHTLRTNAIFTNGRLGIDLGGDGVTDNDPGDGDTGANQLQNFPQIEGTSTGDGNTTITGKLQSAPDTTYRLEFFANTDCGLLSYGEGQQFVGAADVTACRVPACGRWPTGRSRTRSRFPADGRGCSWAPTGTSQGTACQSGFRPRAVPSSTRRTSRPAATWPWWTSSPGPPRRPWWSSTRTPGTGR